MTPNVLLTFVKYSDLKWGEKLLKTKNIRLKGRTCVEAEGEWPLLLSIAAWVRAVTSTCVLISKYTHTAVGPARAAGQLASTSKNLILTDRGFKVYETDSKAWGKLQPFPPWKESLVALNSHQRFSVSFFTPTNKKNSDVTHFFFKLAKPELF